MKTLLERIHERHVETGQPAPTCPLCVEARYRTEARRPRWFAGLTIRQLEAATGINRGRLSILERGVVPRAEEAERILRALANALPPESAA